MTRLSQPCKIRTILLQDCDKVVTTLCPPGNFCMGRQVLQERGVNTNGMNGDEMRKILAGMDDFKNEKSVVKHYIIHKGHITVFLPKFHPELNPIERVWAQLKRYKKSNCKYSIQSLRKSISDSYDSVALENILNHCCVYVC